MGGLQIREPLGELQDGHQSQPPWRQGRLSVRGEERREQFVAEQVAACVGEAKIRMAVGEDGMGDTGGILGNRADGLWTKHSTPPIRTVYPRNLRRR